MAHALPLFLLTAAVFVPGMAHAASNTPPEEPLQIANPASQYCVSLGGKLEIRKVEGGEAGYCHLPDGRIVEEWELFRANHPQRQDNTEK